MDFFTIKTKPGKGYVTLYPDFKVCRSKDLMVKGQKFCAIWDAEAGVWSTDLYDVQRLVDKELQEAREKYKEEHTGDVRVSLMSSYSTKTWNTFLSYVSTLSDNYKLLDRTITFDNSNVKKDSYVSHKLNYKVENIPTPAYTELTNSLYEPEEIRKFEWIIGSIIAGDSREIQKFLVFYGATGTGKSTIINIIQKLFDGYYTTFNAKALGNSNAEFALEPFRLNPLIAIQHDGDLSHIEDNTRLNSVTSHEPITINVKHRSMYTDTFTTMCIMGTNKPVKITDAQSGIIRRLIDVSPKGIKIPVRKYEKLIGQIDFELGGIAYHCLKVYEGCGRNYYFDYRPLAMMQKTDVFFNFVKEMFEEYDAQNEVTLSKAWQDYKSYCESSSIKYDMPQYKFREELKEYFENFEERGKDRNGKWARNIYTGFKANKIYDDVTLTVKEEEPKTIVEDFLNLSSSVSLLDKELADCPAQYAKDDGTPEKYWSDVKTKLSDIDTRKLHYCKMPLNHIVIDFDLKDESGNKSLEKNIEAAGKFPPTYAEVSKSGSGLHLHYVYTGDPNLLAPYYADNIEVKVFKGKSALRRMVTKCNNYPVANISSGLPIVEETKDMISFTAFKNDKALDTLIRKALKKDYPKQQSTREMINLIYDSLEAAYKSGIDYDMSKWFTDLWAFASQSSNSAKYCLSKVMKMKLKSKNYEQELIKIVDTTPYIDDRIVFFDVEIFPNLFVLVWKFLGEEGDTAWVNPTPEMIQTFMRYKLVGFNCRRYDNHIIYAGASGFTNYELYKLSHTIVKEGSGFIASAYNLSYADIYDFSTEKKSLKRFEIELGLFHQELPLDWDKPVPEDRIDEVVGYCRNDVKATEAVFLSEDRQADFEARCLMAKLSGLTPNDTTRVCAEQFMFGDDKNPQVQFNYVDLSKEFDTYTYSFGVSTFMGEEIGEGGYVFARPGAYGYTIVLDVASMHPHSVLAMELFGPKYTPRFRELVEARIAVKHMDIEAASKFFDGLLVPYMSDENGIADKAKCAALAYALKIIINSVYGLTAASFKNRFRDPRNIDNIVAKRGALFMCQLKHEVEARHYTVAHIKTDSIKIPDPSEEIISFVKQRGLDYGYTFEIEEEFDRLCLVNNAVYIGKLKEGYYEPEKGPWTATGAEFQHPYVFKTLFSKQPVAFEDLCEIKQVTTEMYLDFNEDMPDKHKYHFVGKVGSFVPVKDGCDGGLLVRKKKNVDVNTEIIYDNDDLVSSVNGAKGYRWKEAPIVKTLGEEDTINQEYYNRLALDAKNHISEFCDYDLFVADETFIANNIVYSENKLNPDIPFDI